MDVASGAHVRCKEDVDRFSLEGRDCFVQSPPSLPAPESGSGPELVLFVLALVTRAVFFVLRNLFND
jgi:hypothetical protein